MLACLRRAPGVIPLAVLVAAGGCAGESVTRRAPERPRVLTVLLQRGALASAALTLGRPGGERAEPFDPMPDALRPDAARRHPERALPVPPRSEVALARLEPGGPLVAVAIGDFSAPLVVVDRGGGGALPQVLLEGKNVRLLARLPRGSLRDVMAESAVLAASPGGDGSVRLGAGLPVERLGPASRAAAASDDPPPRELSWIRYRDREVEVVGLLPAERVAPVFRPAPPAELTAGDAEVATPFFVFDKPGGRNFATVWQEAGPVVPALRLRQERGYTLVRIDLSRDVTMTGWVRSLRVEESTTNVRQRPGDRLPGHWLSIAGLRERNLRCVELARATRLHERPGGRIAGLVTRGDRFVLLGQRSAHWIQVGVGHPFGLARLWVPARQVRATACDRVDRQPGTS